MLGGRSDVININTFNPNCPGGGGGDECANNFTCSVNNNNSICLLTRTLILVKAVRCFLEVQYFLIQLHNL